MANAVSRRVLVKLAGVAARQYIQGVARSLGLSFGTAIA